jgi:protein TonB
MNFRWLVFIACFLVPLDLDAAQNDVLMPTGTRAVDAKGVHHDGDSYPHKRPPWLDDIVKKPGPNYPYSDRAKHHTGRGLFRIYLDLQTGAVTQVATLQSTGFATLDESAVAALRRWRWKPGKWKEIEIPVTFVMGHVSDPLPRGATQLWPR